MMDAKDQRDDAADLGGGVELALALAALRGEVPHQVFVGIAQDVVAFGAVLAEIQAGGFEDRYQVRQAVHHLLTAPELVGVVEVGYINHTLEIVGFSQPGDNFVDFVADLFIAL